MRERDSLEKIWKNIEKVFLKTMEKDKTVKEKYDFICKEYQECL